jgi:hypothetical protein
MIEMRGFGVRGSAVGSFARVLAEPDQVALYGHVYGRSPDGDIWGLERWGRNEHTCLAVITKAGWHGRREPYKCPHREKYARKEPEARDGTQHFRRILWIDSTPHRKGDPISTSSRSLNIHSCVAATMQPKGANSRRRRVRYRAMVSFETSTSRTERLRGIA